MFDASPLKLSGLPIVDDNVIVATLPAVIKAPNIINAIEPTF
jgi:hypothetical protein